MISIRDLQYRYPSTDNNALDIDQLDIAAGEFCLLSGESGSGKSTLLRLFNGLVPHFSGGTICGSIQVDGHDPIVSGPQVMSSRVGFVFQEVENQFVMDTVEEEIAFSMEQQGLHPGEMDRHMQEILARLNLSHLRYRRMATLSGGEMQQIAIAAALVMHPPILVLDEPTSQLGPLVAEQVLEWLKKLQEDLGLTIILAEQRLYRVLSFADRLIILSHGGRLSANGRPAEVIRQVSFQPPLVQLALHKNWQPLPLNVDQAKPFVESPGSFHNPPQKMPVRSKELLNVQGLRVRLGDREVLQNINMNIHQGERLVIMGPNGAGKSTLLRSLIGLTEPVKGKIIFDGKAVKFGQTARLSQRIGFLPQDPNALLFSETVAEEMATTLKNHRLEVNDSVIEDLLRQLNLSGKSQQYPRDLSSGEKQRTALGAIVITQPDLIMLDEPTRGLDQITKDNLLDLLFAWSKNGKSILLVTHDVEFAAQFASRMILLEDGKIVQEGDPRQVMRYHPRYSPQIAQLYPKSGWLTMDDVIAAETNNPLHD